jgi:hypothetical protein
VSDRPLWSQSDRSNSATEHREQNNGISPRGPTTSRLRCPSISLPESVCFAKRESAQLPSAAQPYGPNPCFGSDTRLILPSGRRFRRLFVPKSLCQPRLSFSSQMHALSSALTQQEDSNSSTSIPRNRRASANVDVSTCSKRDAPPHPPQHNTKDPNSVLRALATRNPNTPVLSTEHLSRKPSPGLLARLKLFDKRNRKSAAKAAEIGRIPESQLRQLEDLHRRDGVEFERRIPLIPLSLPDTGGNDLLSAMAAFHESDASSVMSVSDRLVPSDDSDEDPHTDTQKYRLPEIGKSRGSSRNGFVLEDGTIALRDRPPTPPAKDPPSYRNSYYGGDMDERPSEPSDLDSYFNHHSNLSRAGSIYTLSRASFTNQLSQLTSIKLPQASSLSTSISAILTSGAAARALNDASESIRMWIKKASEVLNGLDAEDDVEWAAAGGREGLGDVDAAITRFETLIDVYVGAIEQLELRHDIGTLSAEELQGVVERMEKILKSWKQIKNTLQGIKEQVEVAMEWEELWNTVLGEIGQEVEGISRMIFEMEERRHRGLLDAMAEPGHQLDIKELETIVEEAPSRTAEATAAGTRLSVSMNPVGAAAQSPAPQTSEEDKNLVGLFARMQPLRASLDFLPMRLSAFMMRASEIFPSGCDELHRRQEFLEDKYKKLEADAESLRKELGEDRWVIIFRKASRQALKMCESVERSVTKLRDGLDEGTQHTNPAALAKKIENYDAKKEHYGPAIQQVLSIIDKGVQTRLTVNGEILRLQADMVQRWNELEALTKAMDFALEQLQVSKNHTTLRDSISTILSEQRSVTSSTGGTMIETPGSSPASSIVLTSRQSSEHGVSSPYAKSRQSSFTSSTTTRSQMGKRYSSMPASMASSQSNIPRKTPLSRSSVSDLRPGSRVSGVSSRLYTTPTPARSSTRTESRPDSVLDRPRWNASTNLKDTVIGHNFKPLSATSPSSDRKSIPPRNPRSVSTPQPSPLARDSGIRPPSALASSGAPSTPAKTTSRIRAQQSVSNGPKSRLSLTVLSPPPKAGVPYRSSSSLLPRSSMYQSPGSQQSFPTTPSSAYAPSPVSSTSTVTLTNHSRKTSAALSSLESNSSADTGASTAGAEQPLEESPSTRGPKSRPSTSMAGRRISLLPTPKRTSSGPGDINSPAPPNGRSSRAGGGRMSSLGGRMSSFGLGKGK